MGRCDQEKGKNEAVADFPRPVTKKKVRSFLGLTGYYRKFVPDYATVELPLTDCTKKSAPSNVTWTDACETAFAKLSNRAGRTVPGYN